MNKHSIGPLQESKRETAQAIIGNQRDQIDIRQLGDRKISMALMSVYVVLMTQFCVLTAMGLTGTSMDSNIRLLSKILVGISFAYALPVVLGRSRGRFFWTYYVCISVFLFHYLVFAENRIYQRELLFPLFGTCLPAFIYSSVIYDWEVLKRAMRRASHIVFCLAMFLAGLIVYGKYSVGDYSQAFSYYVLLPTVMFIDGFLDRPSLKDIVFAFLSILLILAIGSRGPIMCIVVFTMLRFARAPKRSGYRKVFAYLVLISLAVIVTPHLDEVLTSVDHLFSRFGISSRTISLFFEPGLHWSSRKVLFGTIVGEIANNPLTGIGMGGDRRVLEGQYPHNVFLELMAHYGVPLGGLFLLVFLTLILRVFPSKNEREYSMLTIWFSIGVIPLLVSGSYIESMHFWTFLGLMTKGATAESRY